jgi:hypothetical protein
VKWWGVQTFLDSCNATTFIGTLKDISTAILFGNLATGKNAKSLVKAFKKKIPSVLRIASPIVDKLFGYLSYIINATALLLFVEAIWAGWVQTRNGINNGERLMERMDMARPTIANVRELAILERLQSISSIAAGCWAVAAFVAVQVSRTVSGVDDFPIAMAILFAIINIVLNVLVNRSRDRASAASIPDDVTNPG